MEPATISNLVNLGCGGAVIATVGLFLAYLVKMQRESRAEREAERKSLMDLIVNDLCHVEANLMNVNTSLQQVNTNMQAVHVNSQAVNESLQNVNGSLGEVVKELRALHKGA